MVIIKKQIGFKNSLLVQINLSIQNLQILNVQNVLRRGSYRPKI